MNRSLIKSRSAKFKHIWRKGFMRVLLLDAANEDHKLIFIRLVQSLNIPDNQRGDRDKQRKLVKLQDLLEDHGRKFKTEVTNRRGGLELADAIELAEGPPHEIKITPEALFDLLKDCWKVFSESGACSARDSMKVWDYIDSIPSVQEEPQDAKKSS